MTLQPIPFVLLLLALVIELCRGVSISGCKADERNALLNLKKNVEDKHSRLASWKDEDCCNWDGVSCNNITGHVVRLDLRNPCPCSEIDFEFFKINADILVQCKEWSLMGHLSPSLVGLKQLNYLDLSINQFDGPIPRFLGSLHNLRYLNLSLAGFHGFIPHHLGNLSRLNYLDLSNIGWNDYDDLYVYGSQLGINIDDSRWISRLTSLKHLTMTFTEFENFQNWIEALNELSNIVEIRLSYCRINGFPLSLPYVNFTNLSYLDLSHNSIDSEMIPLWLFNIKSLTHIDIQSNHFKSIPDALKNLTSLEYIDFSGNEFSGALPQALKSLRKVHTLDLSFNYLNGSLPNWFWNVFATHDTCIWLDLSNNGINGSLPHLPKLCFGNFNLSSNFFSGPLPPTLNISGSLDISNNSFYGPISPFICNTNLWNTMSLSRNNFSGKIPSCICRLTNVQSLDFSRNLLTDELPNCWGVYNEIIILDFSRNNLSGNIPHTLGTLITLSILRLDNNILSGNIPSTLRNCTYLVFLDLSFNNLKGKIPLWFGENLNMLEVLVLRSNNFTGNVPSNLSKLKSLRILILGNNNLFGRIPRSFGNFSSMVDLYRYNNLASYISRENLELIIKGRESNYHELLSLITNIDLSCNELSGQIPTEIGNLRLLNFLNLSENHLVGSIPSEFGLMHSLESLDMSKNGLSGNIPLSMSTMTTLDFLNLSYNNLSGRIPTGNQLQVLKNESYIGNPELCGFPLTQLCDSNKTTNVEVLMDEVTESDYWYVSIALGFVLGFWIVWVTLFLKKKWKDAYFRYVDYVYDAIFVAIAVNINRFKRKLGNEIASG